MWRMFLYLDRAKASGKRTKKYFERISTRLDMIMAVNSKHTVAELLAKNAQIEVLYARVAWRDAMAESERLVQEDATQKSERYIDVLERLVAEYENKAAGKRS